jgi:hypothetical protein
MLDFLPGGSVAEVKMEPASSSWESIPATERAAGSVPAVPRLVFKRTDDALLQSDRQREVGEIRAKIARDERLTRHERCAFWSDWTVAELRPLLKAGKIRGAVHTERKMALCSSPE